MLSFWGWKGFSTALSLDRLVELSRLICRRALPILTRLFDFCILKPCVAILRNYDVYSAMLSFSTISGSCEYLYYCLARAKVFYDADATIFDFYLFYFTNVPRLTRVPCVYFEALFRRLESVCPPTPSIVLVIEDVFLWTVIDAYCYNGRYLLVDIPPNITSFISSCDLPLTLLLLLLLLDFLFVTLSFLGDSSITWFAKLTVAFGFVGLVSS